MELHQVMKGICFILLECLLIINRFGWGPKNGFVYQKGYVEFFVSPDLLQRVLGVIKSFPYLTYHAINTAGESFSNAPQGSANAVTWGVFPGKEIVQPTVVESDSFFVWKVIHSSLNN